MRSGEDVDRGESVEILPSFHHGGANDRQVFSNDHGVNGRTSAA